MSDGALLPSDTRVVLDPSGVFMLELEYYEVIHEAES